MKKSQFEINLRLFFTNSLLYFIILLSQFQISCNKSVDVSPPVNSITGSNVYESDATAVAVMNGLYAQISGSLNMTRSVSLRLGLSADELSLYTTDATLLQYYRNALTNSQRLTFWETFYTYLETINSVIEGISKPNSITPSVKQQLLGEAKFMRAFIHFYLVNLYGDVPIVTTTDYRLNSTLSRSPQNVVYGQIIKDLQEAKTVLNSNYLSASLLGVTNERVRPNKWAASALLARAYLNTENWAGADSASTEVINNTTLYDTVPLNNVFLKNSKEAIWQLQPVNTGWNTDDGRIFILPSSGPSSANPVYLDTNLVNTLEPGDQRKTNWIKSITIGNTIYYYPFKYKIGTFNSSITSPKSMNEYQMVLRLSEQYLIRAEARVQQNNIAEAKSDLNRIRSRAGLLATLANDKTSLLNAILHERQVELFTEWGHRWIDLKRTGKVDAVMSVVCERKGGAWSTNWKWYPLPIYDIQNNSNLVQNPGY